MADPNEFDAPDLDSPMIEAGHFQPSDPLDPEDPGPAEDWATDAWATDTWATDQDRLRPVGQPASDPPPRIRKRRIVSGVLFLVLGLAGVVADAFNTSANAALAISTLIGALTLLGGLVASEKRRRQIVRFS